VTVADQLDRIVRGTSQVVSDGELRERLGMGRPLRIKLGVDPTSADLHLGHTVVLEKLRQFQDLGHQGVLIIGDYTALIGDPSGRSATRPQLSPEQVEINARTYQDQAFKVLDPERTEVRRNGEWFSRMQLDEVIRLAGQMTIARILERDDFAKRYGAGEPISVSELLYPLMQAYDSVAVESDVELGGTDQLYNLLAGRDVMEAYGLEPQVALTTPLLLSWDGQKMSSSVGNNIPLTAAPEEQFGRTMRIPDSQLEEWYRLVAQRPVPAGDPMDAKLELARFIVTRSHGEEAARTAEEHFTRVVREGAAPDEVPEVVLAADGEVHLPALLVEHLGVASTSEARRLISQGAVKVNGEAVSDLDLPREALDGALVQAGKRRFMRFRAP